MNYYAFCEELFMLCLQKVQDTERWYLTPHWRKIVNGMVDEDNISKLLKYSLTYDEIEDILKLEVEKRNAMSDKTHIALTWIYELLSQSSDIETEEETEFIKNVVEYKRLNQETIEKAEQLQKEKKIVQNKKALPFIPKGMRFNKGV